MTELSNDPAVQIKQLLRQQKVKDEEMKQLKQNVSRTSAGGFLFFS